MNTRRFFFLLAAVCISLTLSIKAPAILLEQAEETDVIDVLGDNLLFATTPDQSPAAFQPVTQALGAGDFDKARELVNELKSSHPDLPGTWELDGAIKLAGKDYAGAETSLNRALQIAPQTASVLTKLGAAQLAQNKLADAEQTLTKALELDHAQSSAAVMLARLEARQGNLDSARAYYKTAVQHSAGYSTAHQDLVAFFLRTGDYQAVLDLVEPLLETAGTAAAHLDATRAKIGLGQLDEARQSLEAARDMGLPARDVTLYNAVLARFAGDLGRSESLIRNLISDNSDQPYLLHELATTLAAAGNRPGSRDAAMQAAALLPKRHPTRIGLANLLLIQGFASEALQVARDNVGSGDPQGLIVITRSGIAASDLDIADKASLRLLTDYPQYAESYAYRSEVLLRQGKRAQALQIAEQGTNQLPQNVAAWSARAGLLLRLGDTKTAVQVTQKGVDANPDSTELRLQWANALQLNGDTASAEKLYLELAGNENASVVALNNLANMVSADPERRAEALNYARKAHLQAPDSAAINDTLGWVLHLNGKNEEARKSLDVARASAGENIEIICHLGIVKADLDGVEAARSELEQCAANSGNADLSAQAARLLE